MKTREKAKVVYTKKCLPRNNEEEDIVNREATMAKIQDDGSHKSKTQKNEKPKNNVEADQNTSKKHTNLKRKLILR